MTIALQLGLSIEAFLLGFNVSIPAYKTPLARKIMRIKLWTIAAFVAFQSLAFAQPPAGERGEGRGPGGPGGDDPAARLMALDKNKDGKLTEDEYADSRMKPLIERADADKDKTLTREELTAFIQREMPNTGGPGGPGFGREGGGFGRGGMRGMMMRPGIVMPEFLMQELQLNEEQRAKIAKLQATVDAEMAKILNESQQQQLKQMFERRPEGGREGGRFEGGREGGRPEGGREGGRPEGGRPEGGRPEGSRPEGGERPRN